MPVYILILSAITVYFFRVMPPIEAATTTAKLLFFMLVVCSTGALYLLPAIICLRRNISVAVSKWVVVLNVYTAWTGVMWLALMVVACTQKPRTYGAFGSATYQVDLKRIA